MGANTSEVLSSWKEIAGYFGKGVRTVQRWELDYGLPVHRPHKGSHLVIAVPAELDEWISSDFANREAPNKKPASKAFRYRVLVVDDDPTFRETMKALLESREYEVLGAEDGFAGLAALRDSLPDVILSDLKMPNMNGFEYLSIVRHRFPRLPVIAISGEFKGLGVPESVLADAYFEKGSYSSAELFARISALLDELPARPREGKVSTAPVWIPSPPSGQYVVVTCSDCLRTFPALKLQELAAGVYEMPCDYCGMYVSFQITEEAVKTSSA
jgi:CheY-like chemotaxis protein